MTIRPITLRCEYLTNPLGLDVLRPQLSWIPPFDQAAYQIIVTYTGQKIWDTGRMKSAESLQIEYAGPPLESRGRYDWKVRLWNSKGKASAWSAPAFWIMGIFTPGWHLFCAWDQPHTELDKTAWIGEPDGRLFSDKQSLPATYLRRVFQVKGTVKRATLYATALGVYEARLNGQRVGDQVLAPEWTDYRRRVQYQTYDVTALVRPGENVLGAILGAGWFAGRIGLSEGRFNYGHRLRFFARLYVETDAGKLEYFHTDGNWRVNSAGPIVGSDILDGEQYDARREFSGWDSPGFADAGWKPASIEWTPNFGPVVAQTNEPIRITQQLKPVAVTEPQPGVFIIDLGQNMVGWCRATFRDTQSGQTIKLRHAEVLNADGTIYFENMRTAAPIDMYICRGAVTETFEPHFTYHGFRYVEVTGAMQPPELVGCVFHSAAPEAGTFECSAPLLNKIMAAIQWTQRGNLHSTPTDCPQRDERLGWMGDIQVFSQTAIFNRDMAAFFRKFLQDVREAQTLDGRFPDFAPHVQGPENRFTANPGWADAGVIVPWRQWVNYADKSLLTQHYPAMQRWIDYVDTNNPDHIWRNFSKLAMGTYGDWLNSDTFSNVTGFPIGKGKCPKDVYATAFFAHSTDLLGKIARVLGKKSRYDQLARQIRAAFNREFVQPDGKIKDDTQAGYALALHFDLLPARLRPLAARHLVEAMKPFNGHLSTGIQSTVRAMLELTRWGHADIAYELINKTTLPSWGYMVEHGGTTVWERWDGYVEGRGFQNPGMNSFNHYAIGAVGEWMYRVIGGLNPDEAAPGWRHFVVRPIPGGGLTWAKVSYASVRGLIRSEWRIEGGVFTLEVTVPPNTTATIQLPDGNVPKRVKAGVHRLTYSMPSPSSTFQ
ncbi:MAG: glycoside hydrolase family 78 protein [Verrucomicrobiota bacterium]